MSDVARAFVTVALLGVSTSAIGQVVARPGPAAAAASSATSGVDVDDAVNDIIVTAQRRTERLQDVPLAVTAVSGRQLADAQINDTTSLTRLVPSLTINQNAGANFVVFRIRGVGTQLGTPGVEPAVSIVLDGIPFARAAQGVTDLVDIERIEVLRGPQGTLFGKNSTAGVISITTARPAKEFGGVAEFTIAEKNEYRARGTVTGALSDTLRARITGYYNNIGGYLNNVPTGEQFNGSESGGVRGKLEWDATSQLNLLLTGSYSKSVSNCCQYVYTAVTNPLLATLISPIVPSVGNRDTSASADVYDDSQSKVFSLEANYALDGATITSLTGYQDFDTQNNNDADGIYAPRAIFLPGAAPSFYDLQSGQVALKQFTQEVRIASTGQRALNYVAGLYYLNLDLDRTFQRRFAGCVAGGANGIQIDGTVCAVPTFRSGSIASNFRTKNYAAFGQLDWKVIGGLTLLGGARIQRETVSYSAVRPGTGLVTGDIPLYTAATPANSISDTATTGKLGARYEFSRRAQAYLTWSTGYKGSGFNVEIATNFAANAPLRPETVKAWELGFKGSTASGLLTGAVALFNSRYRDLQVQASRLDPNSGIFFLVPTNAGTATVRGVEVEATLRPLRGLSLTGGVTYLHSNLDADGLSCPLPRQINVVVNASGNRPGNTCYRLTATGAALIDIRDGNLPNAPEWRGTAALRYETAITGTDFGAFAQLNVQTQSTISFSLEQDKSLSQRAYSLVDGSIGFTGPNDHFRITLFVKNLFDKSYFSTVGRAALFTSTASPNSFTGYPNKDSDRYFGGTIAYRW